ncbi:MAG: DUF898 domain-containing protein [Magnetococcales bacterium]|nr:DUF898 domain-containing protein [Magnetococcales bacterium]
MQPDSMEKAFDNETTDSALVATTVTEKAIENYPKEDADNNEDSEKIWSQITFTGSGSEYFRIWIVNLFLSILTLGIYSAWAKVRKTRYFYNHINIDGHNLEYTANPLQILKGRVVAALLFGLIVWLSSTANPTDLIIAGAIQSFIILLFPVILVLSLRFSLRNTQYRTINFDFSGSFSQSFFNFLLLPILILPTLGLFIPFITKKQTEFIMQNSKLGKTPFNFNPQLTVRNFYGIYLKFFAGLFVLSVVSLIAVQTLGLLGSAKDVQLISAFFFFIFFAWGAIWLKLAIFKLIWSQIRLDNIIFQTSINTYQGIWIFVSNMFLRIITLGLATPWCQIRWTRYKIESLSVQTSQSLSASFISANKTGKDGNIAEGLDDLGGMDIGI